MIKIRKFKMVQISGYLAIIFKKLNWSFFSDSS